MQADNLPSPVPLSVVLETSPNLELVLENSINEESNSVHDAQSVEDDHDARSDSSIIDLTEEDHALAVSSSYGSECINLF